MRRIINSLLLFIIVFTCISIFADGCTMILKLNQPPKRKLICEIHEWNINLKK